MTMMTDRRDHQPKPPRRLVADATPSSGALMPSAIHKQRLHISRSTLSSDAFRNSQTETPPTENDCDRLAAKSLLAYMRRSIDDILTVVITNLATTTSDRRRHPFSRSSDAFRNSQTETPPIEMTPPRRLVADATPASGALIPSTIHKQRLLRSKTAVDQATTTSDRKRDPFFRSSDAFHDSQTETPPIENSCGSGYHHVWPQT
ncbi:hypothetical protein N7452_006306 [Penicillium brevicompactum]|uniref:Uncharacterized protein n=1 Tax=Penicillium brevicompactum TaxID=5074 RepID=A0A9W9QR11_PENBR|nr:hypothetical protein N7452_006306 [Penicillium brevicompactum]